MELVATGFTEAKIATGFRKELSEFMGDIYINKRILNNLDAILLFFEDF